MHVYFRVVKSISFGLPPPAAPPLSHVQAPAARRPQAQDAEAAGLTFSVAALSQEHWRAGFAPQEQVAFWAGLGFSSGPHQGGGGRQVAVCLPQTQDSPPLPQQVEGFATVAIVMEGFDAVERR